MATWERFFEFGDMTSIARVTERENGLIVSGVFYDYRPAGPDPWSPAEGFMCSVPFEGNEFTWFTRLHSFTPTNHRQEGNQIFLVGSAIAPATAQHAARKEPAFMELDAMTGQCLGDAKTIADPEERGVGWSLGWPAHAVSEGDYYYSAGTAFGSPPKPNYNHESWTIRLPYLLRVSRVDGKSSTTIIGPREHYVESTPSQVTVARDGGLLVVTSEERGSMAVGSAIRKIDPAPIFGRVRWQKNIGWQALAAAEGDGDTLIIGGALDVSRVWAGKTVNDRNGRLQKLDVDGKVLWTLDVSGFLPQPGDPALSRKSGVHRVVQLGSRRFAIHGSAPAGGAFLAKFLESPGANTPPQCEWIRTVASDMAPQVVVAPGGAAYFISGAVEDSPTHHRAYIKRLGEDGQ